MIQLLTSLAFCVSLKSIPPCPFLYYDLCLGSFFAAGLLQLSFNWPLCLWFLFYPFVYSAAILDFVKWSDFVPFL
jgi:hypothetical protein